VAHFLSEAERPLENPSPQQVVERAFELAQLAVKSKDPHLAPYGKTFLALRRSQRMMENLTRAAEVVVEWGREVRRTRDKKQALHPSSSRALKEVQGGVQRGTSDSSSAGGRPDGSAFVSSPSSTKNNTFRPTREQEEAVRAFLEGGDLKLLAVAGSGKTTTLRMMAERAGRRRLLYVAFNRSVRDEAQARFPANTRVYTLHGYAYARAVGEAYREKASRGANGLPIAALEEALAPRLRKLFPAPVDQRVRLYVVRETLARFLSTTAPEPGPEHIPESFRNARRLKETWPVEEAFLVEMARLVWRRMQDPKDPFPLTHSGYVRMWHDAGGVVSGFDAVLVDEAQDLDPVFLEVLNRSALQKVYVGDPRQQIYAWRGAVNAMSKIPAPEATLTQSFRFGEELARGVRAVTRFFGEEVPVVGMPSLRTEVGIRDGRWPNPPFAILARTNLGVLEALLQLWEDKVLPVHVMGGVSNLTWLLKDAHALRWGLERKRPHPDLAVSTWEELEALAQEGLDLQEGGPPCPALSGSVFLGNHGRESSCGGRETSQGYPLNSSQS